MREITMQDILEAVIQKGAGSATLSVGKRQRGPINTTDFLYECMVGVALELTNRLPEMFEFERQKYCKEQEFLRTHGNRGLFTDSYGWSKDRQTKLEFSFSPAFHHYFNRIIVPFLGGKKKGWHNENSKIWKVVKRMIVRGETEKIVKLQQSIHRQILKESQKRITAPVTSEGESFGTDS